MTKGYFSKGSLMTKFTLVVYGAVVLSVVLASTGCHEWNHRGYDSDYGRAERYDREGDRDGDRDRDRDDNRNGGDSRRDRNDSD
jgi:hypothetical protein